MTNDNAKEKEKTCSICFRKYTGFGNNAWPVNEGRCCNQCNDFVVINARLAQMGLIKERTSGWAILVLASFLALASASQAEAHGGKKVCHQHAATSTHCHP